MYLSPTVPRRRGLGSDRSYVFSHMLERVLTADPESPRSQARLDQHSQGSRWVGPTSLATSRHVARPGIVGRERPWSQVWPHRSRVRVQRCLCRGLRECCATSLLRSVPGLSSASASPRDSDRNPQCRYITHALQPPFLSPCCPYFIH